MLHPARLLCGLCLLLPALARAGSLQEVEDAARKRPSGEKSTRSVEGSRQTRSSYHDQPASEAQDPGTSFWLLILFAPWSLPRLLADDPCLSAFALYPYHDGTGQLRYAPREPRCPAAPSPPPEAPRRVAAQADFEAGYVLDDIMAGTFAARLQAPRRIELDGRITFMQDLVARPREQALSGTTHLTLRFAQSRRVDFRSGIGLRAFSLHKPLYGFDFFYGMDMYSRRPLLVHFEGHLGTLGDAFAGQVRATLGVQLWKLELYAGYDHTVFIGASKAKLGGPVLGMRAWF